jgi:iron complex transport system ATP-binding protein
MTAKLLVLQAATTRLARRDFGPFDLRLRAGERIAILGPSGAGKSTLLKLIAGERSLQGGRLQLAGRDLASWSPGELAQRRAVLPQSLGVAFGLPVELIVALGRFAQTQDPAQPRTVAAALAAARAAHLAGRRFDTLSGGEQARVQLARVMAQLWHCEQALLLVDEPVSALDPGLQLELLDALHHFAHERGHALVAVLHDVQQALGHFRRLWLVQQGRLHADLPAEPAALPALSRLFGVELECATTASGGVAVLARRPAAPALAA